MNNSDQPEKFCNRQRPYISMNPRNNLQNLTHQIAQTTQRQWPTFVRETRGPTSLPNTPTNDQGRDYIEDVNGFVLPRQVRPWGHRSVVEVDDDKPIAPQDQKKIMNRMGIPSNSPDYIAMDTAIQLTKNEFAFNANYDYSTAFKVAVELSKKELQRNPEFVFNNFAEAFYGKKFGTALELRKEVSCTNACPLIDKFLDTIPWRISCEYYQENGKIRWINSWIKIGWWSENVHEISPQLQSGKWIADGNTESDSIPGNKFSCVVLKGKSKDVLVRILEAKVSAELSGLTTPLTNVELKHEEDYWIPIEVAFKESKSLDNIFDLAKIEIGSLMEVPEFNLDFLRIPSKESIKLDDGTELHFFCGCVLGAALKSGNGILRSSCNDVGDVNFDFDFTDEDELEYYQSDDGESEVID